MNAARFPKMLALGRSDHDQLIAQIQYLTIEENQILRSKLPKRVSLTPKERQRLIRFGKFDQTLKRFGIDPYSLLVQAPLLNVCVERWIKSLKSECLDHFIPVGTKHLDYLIGEYVEHYHNERPHQGLGNKPTMHATPLSSEGEIKCDTRLGGLLRHYHRAA